MPNPKYKSTKKNGGVIPAVTDKRTLLVPIGCGYCMECKKKKGREWQVRLLEEVKHNTNGTFITLTFSNKSIKELRARVINEAYTKINKLINSKIELNKEDRRAIHREKQKTKGYNLDNEIATEGVRLWLERWRRKSEKSVRHFLITELGHNGTENVHLHGIIWHDNPKAILEKWQYGYVWDGETINGEKVNYVNQTTVNYITKYISKMDFDHKYYIPKILASHKPGIGFQYTKTHNASLHTYNENKTIEYYKTNTGHKIAMPIYYRNKLFTEDEREKLWIEKLNKEIRYVGGEKVDISKGYEEFDKLTEVHRKLNRELGYGEDTVKNNRKEYEEERRKIMLETRLRKSAEWPRRPGG